MIKVLYTDYDHAALVYVCGELRHDGDSCAPDKEFVYGLSRTLDIRDAEVRDMIDAMDTTCFTQDDVQWYPRHRESRMHGGC